MKRKAHAVWEGGLMEGQGRLTTESKALADARYSFPIRFGDEVGANPEELIAAAHAGCFSMSLAFLLGEKGLAPQRIATTAELTVEKTQAGWSVVGIRLSVTARVPGTSDAEFRQLAAQAERGCLVSRLVNTEITLEARLETPHQRP